MAIQEDTKGGAMVQEITDMLRINYRDLFTAAPHSRDFNATRASYINSRINVLALLFAVLAPAWIPLDMLMLDGAALAAIVVLRLIFAAAMAALAFWGASGFSLTMARRRLALFAIFPGLFYVAASVVMNTAIHEESALIGYTFFPFLMIALLAVVPLTLVEGLIFISLSALFYPVAVLATGQPLLGFAVLSDLWLLALLAMVAMWIQMSQLHMLMRLYREATRDALTGLVNRRVFITWLQRERDRALADNKPLAVLMMDLDKFKRVNDDYGHLTGDRVLERFANLLRRILPPHALIGRYGGEEFIVILPGNGTGEAAEIAEAIRAGCHEERVAVVDGEGDIGFTTSIGVTLLRADDESVDDILARADSSLYSAKHASRDCVMIHPGD